jgi:ferredoxin-NADP reductase
MFSPEWYSIATLVSREVVAVGTQRLTFAVPTGVSLPHRPGHIVTLSLSLGETLARRVYTVSECDTFQRRLVFTLRIVTRGRLSPVLAALPLGTSVELSGCRRQPVEAGIEPAATEVIGIGTGSAAGPLLGFAKDHLARPHARPLSLVLGFRHAEAVCFTQEFEALATAHRQFRCVYTVSAPTAYLKGPVGRVGIVAPAHIGDLRRTHFHLIGNGTMVTEWRTALRRVDVDPARITTESYFRTAMPDENAIAALTAALKLRLK